MKLGSSFHQWLWNNLKRIDGRNAGNNKANKMHQIWMSGKLDLSGSGLRRMGVIIIVGYCKRGREKKKKSTNSFSRFIFIPQRFFSSFFSKTQLLNSDQNTGCGKNNQIKSYTLKGTFKLLKHQDMQKTKPWIGKGNMISDINQSNKSSVFSDHSFKGQ